MRVTAALLPAKFQLKLKQVYPISGSWGRVGTTAPQKQVNDSTEGRPITNAEPTVAFSKPPPMPPVIGPLVALSLLESWRSRDGDDD